MKLFFTLLLAIAFLASCERGGPTQAKLVLTGSSTVAPLVAEIAKRFEAQHAGVRVDVQTGGSSRGIADVRRGTADIGMVSRALKNDEADLAGVVIARDGVGLIVHRDNPLLALSDEQTAAIFTGRIKDWSELGGKSGPITVISKAEGRATLEVFLAYTKLKSEDIKASVIIGDNQQGIRSVATDPQAIAYVSVGAAELEIAQGLPLRLLPVGGIAATSANVGNGTFPLSRPLLLVTRGQAQGLALSFIEFAQSPAVADLVLAQLYVPPS
jgi:phosphate transport system substrate-binding protein